MLCKKGLICSQQIFPYKRYVLSTWQKTSEKGLFSISVLFPHYRTYHQISSQKLIMGRKKTLLTSSLKRTSFDRNFNSPNCVDKHFLCGTAVSVFKNEGIERTRKKSGICSKSTHTNISLENEKYETGKPPQIEDIVLTNASANLKLNKVAEVHYNDSEATGETFKLFSSPKNILHNFFEVLSKETNQRFLKLSPSYKPVKDRKASMWVCTYHIRWPEEVKFLAKDSKKSVASHKAALAVLSWLMKKQKITSRGMPIIFEKEEVIKLSRQTIPSILLDKTTVENMKKIVDLHHTKMVPHIIKSLTIADDNGTIGEEIEKVKEPADVNFKKVKKQRYISLEQYLAKEKVVLPIAPYKAAFEDLLMSNQVIIVKGEPGCGKSTRIPQYVLEAWAKEDGLLGEPCRIAVTQPRRIAAISLAERVASERNESIGSIVGHQVRLNSNFRPETGRILYCTTGILLRHFQSDPRLNDFSHIILDEAHERDVNTDLLMNLLRTAIKINPKLKLIVMSATIDTDMFSKYYGGAPVMEIPGFTYPVKQNFLENCKMDLSKTLHICEKDIPTVIHEDVVKVIKYIHNTKEEGAILCFLPGWEDISKIQRMIPETGEVAVYCLHSRLQDSEQWKIFSRPPPGVRKIILATNIAETSVTIDDVVYVVDTGIHKDQRFDVEKGIKCIDNHWISKASATQRKGRAGRVQPGESFHLYPRSKYESFPDYSLPEILRTSLTKIVLDSKVFSNNMNALEFMGKLPTPPEENATLKAVDELMELELLNKDEGLTTLGKTVAEFQLEPKLSKAMVNAVIFKCATPIVDIVTLFSAETELFVSGLLDKEEVKGIKKSFSTTSDHLAMMRILEKWLEISEKGDTVKLRNFCYDANLLPYKMQTIEKLRKIHFDYLNNGLFDVMPISDDYSDNDELVKAVLFSGVGNVLQHRNWDLVKNQFKNNVNVLLTRNNHKATITSESVNYKRHTYPTNFLLYINETRSNIRRTTIVRECSLIPKIAVLLFSNRNLEVKEVEEKSSNIDSNDQVKLVVENTNIQLLCDKAQAEDLIKCRDAIMASYRYFIRQLTDLGEFNPEVNSSWDSILDILNELLQRNRVQE